MSSLYESRKVSHVNSLAGGPLARPEERQAARIAVRVASVADRPDLATREETCHGHVARIRHSQRRRLDVRLAVEVLPAAQAAHQHRAGRCADPRLRVDASQALRMRTELIDCPLLRERMQLPVDPWLAPFLHTF